MVRVMRKDPILIFVAIQLMLVSFASAQSSLRTDVMGSHLNYGRGCAACHTPHSPVSQLTGTSSSGPVLWGEGDPTAYGAGLKTYLTAKTPERSGILLCLTCHDGNYASAAPMKGQIFDTLPDAYGTYKSIPTFVDRPRMSLTTDADSHPVGLETRRGCGGPTEWDCTITKGILLMNGSNSARFASSYGFFNKPHLYEGKEVVLCVTCHNPHSENIVAVTRQIESTAFRAGTYPTHSFLRAPYAPGRTSRMSNLSAQYCRQCHADMSNEMNGGTSGTVL